MSDIIEVECEANASETCVRSPRHHQRTYCRRSKRKTGGSRSVMRLKGNRSTDEKSAMWRFLRIYQRKSSEILNLDFLQSHFTMSSNTPENLPDSQAFGPLFTSLISPVYPQNIIAHHVTFVVTRISITDITVVPSKHHRPSRNFFSLESTSLMSPFSPSLDRPFFAPSPISAIPSAQRFRARLQ
jgi:hypothetical protein